MSFIGLDNNEITAVGMKELVAVSGSLDVQFSVARNRCFSE